MIRDFDTVKSQLKELAEVINAFKSEAVQLRIIDLVIGGVPLPSKHDDQDILSLQEPSGISAPVRQRIRKRPVGTSAGVAARPLRSATKGKPGGSATLESLISSGFFKTARTISSIVDYCETSLALKYKQSDFSGPLMRQVRERHLSRKKNADGQYEYIAA